MKRNTKEWLGFKKFDFDSNYNFLHLVYLSIYLDILKVFL